MKNKLESLERALEQISNQKEKNLEIENKSFKVRRPIYDQWPKWLVWPYTRMNGKFPWFKILYRALVMFITFPLVFIGLCLASVGIFLHCFRWPTEFWREVF